MTHNYFVFLKGCDGNFGLISYFTSELYAEIIRDRLEENLKLFYNKYVSVDLRAQASY